MRVILDAFSEEDARLEDLGISTPTEGVQIDMEICLELVGSIYKHENEKGPDQMIINVHGVEYPCQYEEEKYKLIVNLLEAKDKAMIRSLDQYR